MTVIIVASEMTFRRTGTGYTVTYTSPRDGTQYELGTIAKNVWGVWVGTHADGTPGPGARTRIDAAWALLNS